MYLDAGGAGSIVFRIDNTSGGYPAASYPEKMRLYEDGSLRTTGEIQTTGSNVINFGYDQTKADGATGRIGYGTYKANSLCIVGGATTGLRKITMWDYAEIKGALTINGNMTMPTNNWSYGGGNVVKRHDIYFTPVSGGTYWYYTFNYATYVANIGGTEWSFRATVYNYDTDITSGIICSYIVFVVIVGGIYKINYIILSESASCGFTFSTSATTCSYIFPPSSNGGYNKHCIIENMASAAW
jgi:hypothetical protein